MPFLIKHNSYILLLIVLSLGACDPIATVVIRNKRALQATLEITYLTVNDGTSENTSKVCKCIRNAYNTTLVKVIKLKANSKMHFFCGFGPWYRQDVTQFKKCIQSITLTDWRGRRKYSGAALEQVITVKRNPILGHIMSINIQ